MSRVSWLVALVAGLLVGGWWVLSAQANCPGLTMMHMQMHHHHMMHHQMMHMQMTHQHALYQHAMNQHMQKQMHQLAHQHAMAQVHHQMQVHHQTQTHMVRVTASHQTTKRHYMVHMQGGHGQGHGRPHWSVHLTQIKHLASKTLFSRLRSHQMVHTQRHSMVHVNALHSRQMHSLSLVKKQHEQTSHQTKTETKDLHQAKVQKQDKNSAAMKVMHMKCNCGCATGGVCKCCGDPGPQKSTVADKHQPVFPGLAQKKHPDPVVNQPHQPVRSGLIVPERPKAPALALLRPQGPGQPKLPALPQPQLPRPLLPPPSILSTSGTTTASDPGQTLRDTAKQTPDLVPPVGQSILDSPALLETILQTPLPVAGLYKQAEVEGTPRPLLPENLTETPALPSGDPVLAPLAEVEPLPDAVSGASLLETVQQPPPFQRPIEMVYGARSDRLRKSARAQPAGENQRDQAPE